MQKKGQIPSGFEAIDAHTGGGYHPGTLYIVRTLEVYPDELQDFMLNQIKEMINADRRILVSSLGMDENEFAKCLIINETPQQIQKIVNSDIWVCVKKDDVSYEGAIESISDYQNDIEPDVIIIDSIDEILPPVEQQNPLDTSATDALLSLAKKARIPIIVSDYRNRLEVGIERDAQVTEIELKTDINGTVQAGILSNDKKTVTEDLYGLWRVFEKILKKEQN